MGFALLVELFESLLLVTSVEESYEGFLHPCDVPCDVRILLGFICGTLAFAFVLVVSTSFETLVLGSLLDLQCFDAVVLRVEVLVQVRALRHPVQLPRLVDGLLLADVTFQLRGDVIVLSPGYI